MPSSATPSPLDQLAGIEQMLRDIRWSELWDCLRYETFTPEGRATLAALPDTLATLREVLTEWREAHAPAGMFIPSQAMIERREAAEIALYRLLTPDSPRQAGEEITDG